MYLIFYYTLWRSYLRASSSTPLYLGLYQCLHFQYRVLVISLSPRINMNNWTISSERVFKCHHLSKLLWLMQLLLFFLWGGGGYCQKVTQFSENGIFCHNSLCFEKTICLKCDGKLCFQGGGPCHIYVQLGFIYLFKW